MCESLTCCFRLMFYQSLSHRVKNHTNRILCRRSKEIIPLCGIRFWSYHFGVVEFACYITCREEKKEKRTEN